MIRRLARSAFAAVALAFGLAAPATAEEPKMSATFGLGIVHGGGHTFTGLYGGIVRVIKEAGSGSTAIVGGVDFIPSFSGRTALSAGGGVSHTIEMSKKLRVFVEGMLGFTHQGKEQGNPLTPRTGLGFLISGGVKLALTPKLTATVRFAPALVRDQGRFAKGFLIGFGLQVPIGQ